MQQHLVVAVMASVMWALVGGTALGQVAGSTTIGVTVEEQKVLAVGWSAKKQILDKAVYNSSGEKIGEVEDLIITPEKAVSYAIVGVGGFLGIAQHDVAIERERWRSPVPVEIDGLEACLPLFGLAGPP